MGATEAKLSQLIAPYARDEGGLIRGLRDVQCAFGCIPTQTDAVAADLFNLSLAEVKGVISFYGDFSRIPKGKTVVRICVAEACQSVKGRELTHSVEEKLALKLGDTDASRELTLEPVYCLGLCSCAPAAMVGDQLIGRATLDRVVEAVKTETEERG